MANKNTQIVQFGDLEVLKDNSQLVYSEELEKMVNKNAYLSIVTTNNCQCSCFYCINSHTDKALDLPLEKALENIKKLKEKYDIKECVILGGEPLMYPRIVELVSELKKMNLDKICLTTNGVGFFGKSGDQTYIKNEWIFGLIDKGLTHINISKHTWDGFITFPQLRELYKIFHSKGVMVRVNTNIWKNNHDVLSVCTMGDGTKIGKDKELIPFMKELKDCCDTIRISNLIHKDSFSVNPVNNDETDKLIPSDYYYKKLFGEIIDYYGENVMCIENKSALGFVDYVLIPTKPAIIINRNIDSKVSEQICENEDSVINTFKCLVSGDISLSWNKNNIIKI